ncbi:hypothetical protein BP6252_13738 [Coleophoma cylindrospora]|uniref:Uncharacterized protein n=1 Tax=Coleophoma cylindrospora TaxID=1849047 RepID=A0A3D8Q764_9HELO|nr:hypothetical protein BP6252_13738 [Coleophoma cylindrospora]
MSSTGVGSNPHAIFRIQNDSLLDAARLGDVRKLRQLLACGISLETRGDSGQTALHLAVAQSHEELVRCLLDEGADTEATSDNGEKPLHLGASLGHTSIVWILLESGADVESWNSKTQKTALHQAVCNKHIHTVNLLLDYGANIDAQIPSGETPLILAIKDGDVDTANLLLENGANESILLPNGLTAWDFVQQNDPMHVMLTKSRDSASNHAEEEVGPPKAAFLMGTAEDAPFTSYSIKGTNKANKTYACRGYEATLVDFFKDRPPVQEMASIQELLYGRGAKSIMRSAREAGMTREQPAFSWCYLPANNMEWVKTFIKRLSTEGRSDGTKIDKPTRESLGLTNTAGKHLRATTTNSSFMRPLCRKIEQGPIKRLGESTKGHVMLFMPYLHYEDLVGLEKTSRVMTVVNLEALQLRVPTDTYAGRPVYTRMSLKHVELDTLTRFKMDFEIDPDDNGYVIIKRWVPQYEQDLIWNHTRQLREERAKQLGWRRPASQTEPNIPAAAGVRPTESDATSSSSHFRENHRTAKRGILHTVKKSIVQKLEVVPNSFNKRKLKSPSVNSDEVPQDSAIHRDEESNGPSERARSPTSELQESRGIPRNTGLQSKMTSKAFGDGLPEVEKPVRKSDARDSAEIREAEWETKARTAELNTDLLNETLIKAYMVPSKYGAVPALQPRRTLDQYFYTHLPDTYKRDRDQVVYRYLEKEGQVPRIFMVDQLWLWILDEDTVISCCPQVWNSWDKQKYNTKSSTMNGPDRLRLLPEHIEPLGIRNMVLKAIETTDPSKIKSVYDLSNIIINSCASVFDQHRVPQAFQFLEFFERSIGKVTEKEAACFQDFRETIKEIGTRDDFQPDVLFDITAETELLVEIKDIRDELNILRMVLTDQEAVIKDFNESVAQLKGELTSPQEKQSVGHNEVLDSHVYRIQQMESLAANTHQAINHLLDLKQKQANASEARSARKQAEATRLMAEEAAKQSLDSARQGKTILVFTVITIIFLPLSFMAALFAINIDAYPLNDNGKLPLAWVMKYLITVSVAVSLSFGVLAFQQERIANGFGYAKDFVAARCGTK